MTDMPEAHEHDWRVDPHLIYPTAPPQERLVCAECGAMSARRMGRPPSRDPRTWRRANLPTTTESPVATPDRGSDGAEVER